ncbi:MAG TPA: hypothetical protein VH395_01870 [Jatrophihabitantaceae bacterium]|jgi:hypothetical protein
MTETGASTTTGLAASIRIVLVVLGVTALIALSFAVGRATMGSTGHASNDVRPIVVHPVVTPASQGAVVCHLRGPC